jgi:hypothetical protein
MAKSYTTGLVITGDATGGVKAVKMTRDEIDALNRRMGKGQQQTRRYAQAFANGSREVEFFRNQLRTVAGLAAGVFAASALQNQIDWADRLQKLNLRIGASTEALSQYNYVAGLSGVQFDALATAWQRQTRRIADAAGGTGEAVKALDALNLNAAELAQLRPEQQFERIAAALLSVENPGQRAALAMKLWDTEGVALLQIVNQGTDAIANMRTEADRLGMTVSQQTADDMATFNDEVARLKTAVQGASATLLADLIPGVTESLQAVNGFVSELGGAADILERVGNVAQVLATVYLARTLGPGIAAVTVRMVTMGSTGSAALLSMLGPFGMVNRALLATQVRIAATSVAMRGLAAGMALLGGPAGLLIIGAGLMYTYREEIFQTGLQAKITKEEVDKFKASIKDASDAAINNEIGVLNNELEEAALKAAVAREELDKLRKSKNRNKGGVLGFTGGEVGKEVAGIQAVAEATNALKLVEAKIEAAREEQAARRQKRTGSPPTNTNTISGRDLDRMRDQAQQYLTELRRLHASEAEQVHNWQADSLAQLQSYHQQGLLKEQDYAFGKVAIAEEAARRLQAIEDKRWDGYLGGGLGQLGNDYRDAQQLQGPQGELVRSGVDAAIQDKTFQGLPTVGGLDPSVGGAFSEAARLEQERQQILQAYDQRIADYQAFREMEVENAALYDEQLADLQARRRENDMAAQQAIQQAQLAGAQSTFGSLADIAKTFAGEQSGIYKILFATEKAFAIARSVIAIQTGIAQAAANPWPANLAAMASVAAATASIVSNIAAVAMPQGQAHDGIDYVPNTGTWNLQKGERVTGAALNRDLTEFLERENRSGGRAPQSAAAAPVTVNLIENPSKAGQVSERQGADGQREVDLFVADIFGDGPRSMAIRQKFGLQAQGR